jgi:hypothetical protein
MIMVGVLSSGWDLKVQVIFNRIFFNMCMGYQSKPFSLIYCIFFLLHKFFGPKLEW